MTKVTISIAPIKNGWE